MPLPPSLFKGQLLTGAIQSELNVVRASIQNVNYNNATYLKYSSTCSLLPATEAQNRNQRQIGENSTCGSVVTSDYKAAEETQTVESQSRDQ